MRTRLLTIFTILVTTLFAITANAQDKNATGSVGPVKFSGLMFGDYYYMASAFDSTKKNMNAFQFRRIYITADYTISDNFSSRFRMEADQGEITNNGKITTMVKDAWLQWKDIFQGSNMIFGIAPTPAFDVSEGAWGHRYLEKTIMDLNGIVPSRDLGIALKGKFDDKGTVKYWLMAGNNSGNSPETNKDKRFYGLLEFNPSENLLITVYGDYAAYPDIANNSTDAFVGAGFINYREKGKFSIGAEGFIRSQQNGYTPPGGTLGSLSSLGISVWAYANLSETAQIVGRFDTFDPNTNSASNLDRKNLILAGIQFNPTSKVSITPNVEIFTYQANSPNGGDSSDIIPRMTFYWEF
jgi:hypothetical protein